MSWKTDARTTLKRKQFYGNVVVKLTVYLSTTQWLEHKGFRRTMRINTFLISPVEEEEAWWI